MNVVFTTHSLGEWTAAPGPSVEAAAGVAIRTAHLQVALHLIHWVSRQLGHEICGVVLGYALALDQVTYSVLGAAVQVVGTADGVGHWTTAILPSG